MLKQLLQVQSSLPDWLLTFYENHSKKNTRLSLGEILDALHIMLAKLSSRYIVIDALDEYSNKDGRRSEFLTELRKLQQKTDLHLMITSRFIPDVMDAFSDTPKLEIRAHEDVRRFVAGQIDRLPGYVRRDSALQQLIQDAIAQAVDGMYVST